MSILDTSLNLRDLLRVRDDDLHQDSSNGAGSRNSLARLTLGAVLGCGGIIINNNGSESNRNQFQLQQPPRTPSRTLLDIIKDEESGTSYRGLNLEDNNGINSSNSKQQKSWKSFKDRLLLRKAAAGVGLTSSSSNTNGISDDDYGMLGDSPIRRRSSFSLVSPTTTSIVSPNVTEHVQNDSNEQGNTVVSTLASSSSEPVVIMRLAAALAAEREEQRQQFSSSSSLTSTDTQLQENSTTATSSAVLQVAQEVEDQSQTPNRVTTNRVTNNPFPKTRP
ncbi:hypothetical protein MKW94_029538 [Papaver nudicaule]|uniref:Uncharacterized protein n=1 Tax=Papaver nudicaule TaxID=74823 RepID=A0AA42AY96_PAPNU|nr:hypothetical protein [Papaver nudicaule]